MHLNVCRQSNLEEETWKEDGVKQFAYICYMSHLLGGKITRLQQESIMFTVISPVTLSLICHLKIKMAHFLIFS